MLEKYKITDECDHEPQDQWVRPASSYFQEAVELEEGEAIVRCERCGKFKFANKSGVGSWLYLDLLLTEIIQMRSFAGFYGDSINPDDFMTPEAKQSKIDITGFLKSQESKERSIDLLGFIAY